MQIRARVRNDIFRYFSSLYGPISHGRNIVLFIDGAEENENNY